jgi:hypothetical protein
VAKDSVYGNARVKREFRHLEGLRRCVELGRLIDSSDMVKSLIKVCIGDDNELPLIGEGDAYSE